MSDLGKLRKPSNKSEIICCILKSSGVSETIVIEPNVSCVIVDVAGLNHMLIPQFIRIFQQDSDQIFFPFILMRLKNVDSVNLVFDCLDGRFKNDIRNLRRFRSKVTVKSNVVIYKSFTEFLARSKNKEDLFRFLAKNLVRMSLPLGKKLIFTYCHF